MRTLIFSFFSIFLSVAASAAGLLDEGVSRELAQFRKEHYAEVKYDLSFSIPEKPSENIRASLTLSLTLAKQVPVIFDFTGNVADIQQLMVNGRVVKCKVENQHIVIPEKQVSLGSNQITIKFVAGSQSLNRREGFVYTLLVPDRARTLFPCFDQPDLKAPFQLRLEVPTVWQAIGNGSVERLERMSSSRKMVHFRMTEPISTYLFSFVAGSFKLMESERDGRAISLYHRETDAAKIAQCEDILDEVYHSLAWMEEYTGVEYPFEKYDLIILPGFQYGGMEHMGATLYNDRRMFLEENASANDSILRSRLIAHETAHMWFGDYVTMKWFDDVWNKEVFANWFAAQIVEPMYPHIEQELSFIMGYYPSSYSEDRTGGATPIQQPLDNLRNAGLIYSNVVYNKSPIVMEMLVKKIGKEKFQEAIREYLKKYAYGNSDWDGLIEVLNAKTAEDLIAWSDIWVKGQGMPKIQLRRKKDKALVQQIDLWGMKRMWALDFSLMEVGQDTIIYHQVKMTDDSPVAEIILANRENYVVPNADGRGYGYFQTDASSTEWMLKNWGTFPPIARFSMLMSLYEGVMHNDVMPDAFLQSVMDFANSEKDAQIFRQMLNYAESCVRLFLKPDQQLRADYEDCLFQLTDCNNKALASLALKSFANIASSEKSIERLYQIWDSSSEADRYGVGEKDLIGYSYTLAIYRSGKANEILSKQLARISNPDRRQEYVFVMQALAPTQVQRADFFNQLMLSESWRVEPWAQSALKWLNHPARYPESLEYIRQALDRLVEVQREGDIFFPANWCSALLSGHTSPEALAIVEEFLKEHPNYPNLLESKIRQRADHLYTVNNRQNDRYLRDK
ncbi:MAG: M1 family aminopeptidase [Mangrovibacterium sp.]